MIIFKTEKGVSQNWSKYALNHGGRGGGEVSSFLTVTLKILVISKYINILFTLLCLDHFFIACFYRIFWTKRTITLLGEIENNNVDMLFKALQVV